jgi:hypothetical protein
MNQIYLRIYIYISYIYVYIYMDIECPINLAFLSLLIRHENEKTSYRFTCE